MGVTAASNTFNVFHTGRLRMVIVDLMGGGCLGARHHTMSCVRACAICIWLCMW